MDFLKNMKPSVMIGYGVSVLLIYVSVIVAVSYGAEPELFAWATLASVILAALIGWSSDSHSGAGITLTIIMTYSLEFLAIVYFQMVDLIEFSNYDQFLPDVFPFLSLFLSGAAAGIPLFAHFQELHKNNVLVNPSLDTREDVVSKRSQVRQVAMIWILSAVLTPSLRFERGWLKEFLGVALILLSVATPFASMLWWATTATTSFPVTVTVAFHGIGLIVQLLFTMALISEVVFDFTVALATLSMIVSTGSLLVLVARLSALYGMLSSKDAVNENTTSSDESVQLSGRVVRSKVWKAAGVAMAVAVLGGLAHILVSDCGDYCQEEFRFVFVWTVVGIGCSAALLKWSLTSLAGAGLTCTITATGTSGLLAGLAWEALAEYGERDYLLPLALWACSGFVLLWGLVPLVVYLHGLSKAAATGSDPGSFSEIAGNRDQIRVTAALWMVAGSFIWALDPGYDSEWGPFLRDFLPNVLSTLTAYIPLMALIAWSTVSRTSLPISLALSFSGLGLISQTAIAVSQLGDALARDFWGIGSALAACAAALGAFLTLTKLNALSSDLNALSKGLAPSGGAALSPPKYEEMKKTLMISILGAVILSYGAAFFALLGPYPDSLREVFGWTTAYLLVGVSLSTWATMGSLGGAVIPLAMTGMISLGSLAVMIALLGDSIWDVLTYLCLSVAGGVVVMSLYPIVLGLLEASPTEAVSEAVKSARERVKESSKRWMLPILAVAPIVFLVSQTDILLALASIPGGAAGLIPFAVLVAWSLSADSSFPVTVSMTILGFFVLLHVVLSLALFGIGVSSDFGVLLASFPMIYATTYLIYTLSRLNALSSALSAGMATA